MAPASVQHEKIGDKQGFATTAAAARLMPTDSSDPAARPDDPIDADHLTQCCREQSVERIWEQHSRVRAHLGRGLDR